MPWTESATPPLSLNDVAGRRHTLADYRGSVVLVNFWATWCEPCREEMVTMRKLQERLGGRPFVTLLVNYGESRMRVGEFVKRESIDFPALLDPNHDAPRAWRVRVLPSSFLVDADGRLRYTVIGEIDWTGADAVNAPCTRSGIAGGVGSGVVVRTQRGGRRPRSPAAAIKRATRLRPTS